MVRLHILSVPQPFALVFSHLPRAADCVACKKLKDQQRRQTASLCSSNCRQASQRRAPFISLYFTLPHCPSFTSPSPPTPSSSSSSPLSSEVPLFILTPQPVNLRSLDGHLSAPHHRAAPCRPASRPRSHRSTFFNLCSGCCRALRPNARAPLLIFSPLLLPLPPPSAWMDRELQTGPGERLRGRRWGLKGGAGRDEGEGWGDRLVETPQRCRASRSVAV